MPATATAPVKTIDHGAVMAADPMTGSIPPYAISEWAKDKTPEEMLAKIEERRRGARLRGGLLGWEDLTLEMLLSEALQRRSRTPIERAGDLTPAELARISEAQQARQLADFNRRNNQQRLRQKRSDLGMFMRQHLNAAAKQAKSAGEVDDEGDPVTRESIERAWEVHPELSPPEVQEFLAELGSLEAAVEESDAIVEKALVREHNVGGNIHARAAARRWEVQQDANESAVLANVHRTGGNVEDTKKELKDFRKRGAPRFLPIQRLLNRVQWTIHQRLND